MCLSGAIQQSGFTDDQLLAVIADYHKNLVPLVVPLTLLLIGALARNISRAPEHAARLPAHRPGAVDCTTARA